VTSTKWRESSCVEHSYSRELEVRIRDRSLSKAETAKRHDLSFVVAEGERVALTSFLSRALIEGLLKGSEKGPSSTSSFVNPNDFFVPLLPRLSSLSQVADLLRLSGADGREADPADFGEGLGGSSPSERELSWVEGGELDVLCFGVSANSLET